MKGFMLIEWVENELLCPNCQGNSLTHCMPDEYSYTFLCADCGCLISVNEKQQITSVDKPPTIQPTKKLIGRDKK